MDNGLKYHHTILLVDDEVSITKSLRRVLRKEGYTVITAGSGREGLEALRDSKEKVSLIISDQRMPGMTGIQFLGKIKKILPNAVRFLLTGYTDLEIILDAIKKDKIHQYLTKPWNDSDLLKEVRQGLQHYELVLAGQPSRRLSKKSPNQIKRSIS
jgi:response regulator RpfG family c-di-GMP phosphodiesterase